MDNPLRDSFTIVHDFTTKRLIKQFCAKFDFVYFGHVDHREDEHQLVRGLTASAEHTDNHYAVGNFRGRDITVVERQNTLRFPGKEAQRYRWLIMQIDLRRQELPHIFLDAHHHEEVFYANMFVKFGNFEDAKHIFTHHDPLFLKYFKVFAMPDMLQETAETLNSEVAAMLAHHFRQFDYEIDDDRLLVYASNSVLTLRLLQEMMRVGMWLADTLDAQKAKGPVRIE